MARLRTAAAPALDPVAGYRVNALLPPLTPGRPMIGRSFLLTDQMAFAGLSGDSNPLHIDPVAARRLVFGRFRCSGHQ